MIKLISAISIATALMISGCGSNKKESDLTSEQKQELEKRKERASQKGNALDSYNPDDPSLKKDSSKPSGNGLDSYDPDHTQNKNK